jgi:hypothetical protein
VCQLQNLAQEDDSPTIERKPWIYHSKKNLAMKLGKEKHHIFLSLSSYSLCRLTSGKQLHRQSAPMLKAAGTVIEQIHEAKRVRTWCKRGHQLFGSAGFPADHHLARYVLCIYSYQLSPKSEYQYSPSFSQHIFSATITV